MLEILKNISETSPVLIAGPTASGKSALALEIARWQGGVIVNADALQVFDCWQVLSARPNAAETALAPHALYGHVPYRDSYSTGHWLRDVAPLLQSGPRPIIVGGTGLNFTALTQGLADIPATPPEIRAEADAISPEALRAQLEAEDPVSAGRIDLENPARIQRAWEVLRGTGHGIAAWQDATPPPLLPLDQAVGIVIEAPKDWLTPRIERRFDVMLETGALDEVRAMKDDWDPARPSAKAIGAPELIAYLDDILSLDEAKARAIIATRQYAKRQRTWFRARMSNWHQIPGQIL